MCGWTYVRREGLAAFDVNYELEAEARRHKRPYFWTSLPHLWHHPSSLGCGVIFALIADIAQHPRCSWRTSSKQCIRRHQASQQCACDVVTLSCVGCLLMSQVEQCCRFTLWSRIISMLSKLHPKHHLCTYVNWVTKHLVRTTFVWCSSGISCHIQRACHSVLTSQKQTIKSKSSNSMNQMSLGVCTDRQRRACGS